MRLLPENETVSEFFKVVVVTEVVPGFQECPGQVHSCTKYMHSTSRLRLGWSSEQLGEAGSETVAAA